MTKTAYLRVYQPLETFPPEEQERWLSEPGEGEPLDRVVSTRWLIASAFPSREALSLTETAFVRRVDDSIFVCPWRTRLRMLVGLVAFMGAIPDEVADAFVSDDAAQLAVRELTELDHEDARTRSHILSANWHVPLRWFGAFDDVERILIEDREGLRIRYETPLFTAKARLDRIAAVLERSAIDQGITTAVRELVEWLGVFDDDGLLELDYGSVASLFCHDDLVDDRSAADVWACVDALEGGNLVKAGRLFSALVDRWNEVRVKEVVN